MTTLNLTVGANGDDGICFGATFYSQYLQPGTSGGVAADGWARFTNVTIAQGSTINTAALTGRANAAGDAHLNIYCNDADNATAPTNRTTYDAKAVTTGTAWNTGSETNGNDYTTVDFTGDVQTVINRAGFASGNALLVLVKATGYNNHNIYWKVYEDSTSLCPRLAITYAAGGGATGRLPIPMSRVAVHRAASF